MFRKILYIITTINILFQIIYSIFGRCTKEVIYVFYVFRVEYMLISGFVAFAVLLISIILFIIEISELFIGSRKAVNIYNVIQIVLNIEYIIYYIIFLMKQ